MPETHSGIFEASTPYENQKRDRDNNLAFGVLCTLGLLGGGIVYIFVVNNINKKEENVD